MEDAGSSHSLSPTYFLGPSLCAAWAGALVKVLKDSGKHADSESEE